MEAAVAEPQEDGLCGHRSLGLVGAFIKRALALMSGWLIEELLATSRLLVLTVVSSALIEEVLAGRCLVADTFFLPQGIQGTLPELVPLLHTPLTPVRGDNRSVDGISPAACLSRCQNTYGCIYCYGILRTVIGHAIW
jgi:hypothetical protein